MQLELRAHGKADTEVVWQRYLRPARWSGWAPQIRQVLLTTPDGTRPAQDADQVRPGATGIVRGPLGVPVGFRIDRVDGQPDAIGARQWAWQVRLGPIRLALEHSVRPRSDEGTDTRLVLRGPAPVVLGYVPLAQLTLVRLVQP